MKGTLSFVLVMLLLCTGMFVLQCAKTMHAENKSTRQKKVLGLEKVIAFYGAYPELESQTFARGGEWKYWRNRGNYRWTQTSEELEQQIRLIRFVAPESPGVAFFGKWKLKEGNCPLTDKQLDEICGRFLEIPSDGSGLKPELLELGRIFTKRYERPAIFCSSEFMLPHFHSGHDGGSWGSMHEPPTARVLMMNLGQKDAKGVKARLREPGGAGEVWANGRVDIPARSVVVASLSILPGKHFNGWVGTEILEVEAPGAEVFNFTDSRFHGSGDREEG